MNLTACASLPRLPENAVWYRAIQSQHLATALDTSQTAAISSRFSPETKTRPAYPILYLSENHLVALFEVGAMLGDPYQFGADFLPNPKMAWTLLNVHVLLSQVVDLTDAANLTALRTTAQELTGDWKANYYRKPMNSVRLPTGAAPTQELGEALHRLHRVEGARVISAKMATHSNLIVFPDKLLLGSSIIFRQPSTGQTWTISPRKPRTKRAKP